MPNRFSNLCVSSSKCSTSFALSFSDMLLTSAAYAEFLCLTCFSDRISSCRCDGGDCCRNVGHATVPHKASKARHNNIKRRNCADISSRALRETNTGALEMKNLCRNSKRTTGAEDTQNQHYQRVLTVVASFPKLPFFCVEVHWHGGRLHTTSSWVTSSHRDTDIHQQVTINFGRASITACVTGSARVLDAMLHDEGFNLCFSRVTDYSVMQMRPVRMSI